MEKKSTDHGRGEPLPWIPGLAHAGRDDSCGNESSGAESSWEIFVRRYQPWLRRRCWYALMRWIEDPRLQDVEELVQEVYCRLLEGGRRRLRSFHGRDEKAWRTFLSRIVHTVVVDHVRHRSAIKRGSGPLAPEAGPSPCRSRVWDPGLEDVPCLSPSPERLALIRQERNRLLRPPPGHKRRRTARRNAVILWLAVLEGCSSREVACRLSLSPSTVDSVVHRARVRWAAEGLEVPKRSSGLAPGSAIMASS